MTVGVISFSVLLIYLYLIAGLFTLEAWDDLFDGFEKKYLRVFLKILMLFLWPVFFAVIFILVVCYGIYWVPASIYKIFKD